MSESVKPRQRGRRYQHVNNAVHLTLHTQDGSRMQAVARRDALDVITRVAQEHGLLVNVAET
jgi:hypothetical protein